MFLYSLPNLILGQEMMNILPINLLLLNRSTTTSIYCYGLLYERKCSFYTFTRIIDICGIVNVESL